MGLQSKEVVIFNKLYPSHSRVLWWELDLTEQKYKKPIKAGDLQQWVEICNILYNGYTGGNKQVL